MRVTSKNLRTSQFTLWIRSPWAPILANVPRLGDLRQYSSGRKRCYLLTQFPPPGQQPSRVSMGHQEGDGKRLTNPKGIPRRRYVTLP